MADISVTRILQFPVLTTLGPNDWIMVITAKGESKRIKYSDFLAQILAA